MDRTHLLNPERVNFAFDIEMSGRVARNDSQPAGHLSN